MKLLINENTTSQEETILFGKNLLKQLPKETNLIFINGNIGVGKTTLISGIIQSLGIKENVNSPTYGYKKVYDGIIHYDLFLNKKMKKEELNSLISEDLENNIVLIEWGKKYSKLANSIFINIKYISDRKRKIKVFLKK